MNFELQPWAIQRRFTALMEARGLGDETGNNLLLWNLRGFDADVSVLRPGLERGFQAIRPGLVVLDPVYKLLGDRDENNNGAIGEVMRELERMAANTGASIALAHHFAKGDSTNKSPIDRMSGAGVWARDPDSLLIMSPADDEEGDVYDVVPILRNLPPVRPFKLQWEFPFMRSQRHLIVDGKEKATAFLRKYVPVAPIGRSSVANRALADGLGPDEVAVLMDELAKDGRMAQGGGMVWRTTDKKAAE